MQTRQKDSSPTLVVHVARVLFLIRTPPQIKSGATERHTVPNLVFKECKGLELSPLLCFDALVGDSEAWADHSAPGGWGPAAHHYQRHRFSTPRDCGTHGPGETGTPFGTLLLETSRTVWRKEGKDENFEVIGEQSKICFGIMPFGALSDISLLILSW